jgi:hypothetical protein
MDCGKNFTLDYSIENIGLKETDSPEEKEKKISEFNKNFIIFASNICTKCLQPIVNSKDTANETKTFENKKVEETCNKYISNLKEKFSKEEQDLKKYTLEEEDKKKKELEEIKSIVEKNENHLKSLIKELENTEQKENNFCDDFRKLEMDIFEVEKELSKSNDIKLDYENKIKGFSNTNIFTELFQISFNGKFGRINGCSFLDPNQSSNWDNINGGWGYIILLTRLLSIKYNFDSIKYDLIPIGNFSKIVEKEKKVEYEIFLYDIKLREKFNNAMSAYLEYLEEFINYLFKEGKIKVNNDDICPRITGNLINNKSIRIDNGKDKLEDWFQCMKYLLTILKFLILQVLIDENQAFKENIDDIDIINDNKSTNKIVENKP